MKKFIAGILILLYSCTASGATVHFHYCMERFASWSVSLGAADDGPCGYCGMDDKKDNGCCKDVSKKISIDKEQKKPAYSVFTVLNTLHPIPEYAFSSATTLPLTLTERYPVSNAPPGSAPLPLFVQFRNFRI